MGSVSEGVLGSGARMPWYEYEPLLVYGCTRSKPGVQVGQATHPYSNYDTSSHSGSTFYPSYNSYLNGMLENDFFFIGYKQIPEPPRYRHPSLKSIPWSVRTRWT